MRQRDLVSAVTRKCTGFSASVQSLQSRSELPRDENPHKSDPNTFVCFVYFVVAILREYPSTEGGEQLTTKDTKALLRPNRTRDHWRANAVITASIDNRVSSSPTPSLPR